MDDAIWIQLQGDLMILPVHIANVAELVTPGTDLDNKEIARGQTLYFCNHNTPCCPGTSQKTNSAS